MTSHKKKFQKITFAVDSFDAFHQAPFCIELVDCSLI